jgi:hypothetical protein
VLIGSYFSEGGSSSGVDEVLHRHGACNGQGAEAIVEVELAGFREPVAIRKGSRRAEWSVPRLRDIRNLDARGRGGVDAGDVSHGVTGITDAPAGRIVDIH